VTSRFSFLARPAKHVQRRLVFEVLNRLSPIAKLSDFRYLGLGGLEFADFRLARQHLGVVRMVSIEKDTDRLARYEFNKPYGQVKIEPGWANDVLPEVDLAGLWMVWLDYQGPLTTTVIADIQSVIRRIGPGSVLLVTLNARSPTPRSARRETLVERVGDRLIPNGVSDDTLAKWGYAGAQYVIARDVVRRAIRDRGDDAWFEQLVNIHYADGVQMQTFGGVVVTPTINHAFQACHFDELDFVRIGEDALVVQAPVVTMREALELNPQIPPRKRAKVRSVLSEAEIAEYRAYHRWYPVSD
jgi:hypothetical protein